MFLCLVMAMSLVAELCFDKIEKKGTLLNTTCSTFGTRCSQVSMNNVQYTYWVNELGAQLILVLPEKEVLNNGVLNGLLVNKKMLELKEPFVLPPDVCSKLHVATGYTISTGLYRIHYFNSSYRIYLMP